MGFIETSDLTYRFPGGGELFSDVTFKVRSGQHAALVGANGVGKTTLLRVLAGEEPAKRGGYRIDGRLLYMPQMIGSLGGDMTIADLLLSLSPEAIKRARVALLQAERAVSLPHGRDADLRYANALAHWGDVGGYDAEVLWDVCTV